MYKIQIFKDSHWQFDKATFKITKDLDYFIRIVEEHYSNKFNTFKYVRRFKFRVFDCNLGRVVYK